MQTKQSCSRYFSPQCRWKHRQLIESDFQDFKQELALDHNEGPGGAQSITTPHF
jgi:SRSO17 transposase